MINGLCIGGRTSEAEKLLIEMEEKGCSPNGWTYNVIIRGFINNNETVRAMELIQQMVKGRFSADASTTELIIDLLCKDKVDPALLPLMQKENYELNLPQLKLKRSSDHPNKH
ncbi:PREDICTED: pentatricopeptide repeat-containing [Prunus dulcis]|uniref:PREDICTED: pentatricopeptide repeat-containing n=3 Tax=Prunus dulcis TaxID=3755 RepID=A0A5E4EZ02_PRUDU|nr:PREDICTED: pentatricopeptide repeat-containing [Prunus dulcis]